MKFDPALSTAVLLKRYKRFLADVETGSQRRLTIHCPNTGSMLNCNAPGSRVWYSTSSNRQRKYPHTWEIVEVDGQHLVGINTGRANALVREALDNGVISELRGYDSIRSEVAYGDERSRIDFLLSNGSTAADPRCYVEVKNLTLGVGAGLGVFPDAVTTRGQKHLRELAQMKSRGSRAVLVFCVQHSGVTRVAPADDIDPDYGALLRDAVNAGVEVLAYRARMSSGEIVLESNLPVILD